METLDELAVKHGTDKRVGLHGYTKTYDRHLGGGRKETKAVLEIGVLDGASLLMWRDYFPNAKIFGMDINPARHLGSKIAPTGRVHVFQGDQNERGHIEDVMACIRTPLDLVIDDGSHENESQLISFGILWPHVKPGGMYIIEDVCCSYWQEYGNQYPPKPNSTMAEMVKLVHDVNFRGFRVGSNKHRDAGFLLKNKNDMPNGMYTDIEEMIFANSTLLLRKRG
jgi:hypothetical protein